MKEEEALAPAHAAAFHLNLPSISGGAVQEQQHCVSSAAEQELLKSRATQGPAV